MAIDFDELERLRGIGVTNATFHDGKLVSVEFGPVMSHVDKSEPEEPEQPRRKSAVGRLVPRGVETDS